MTGDPHKALREDVHLLGDLLGHALRTIEGDELYGTVERVRALAKSARAGSEADFDTLADELSRMPVAAALPVARAFAHFLHLANIAEQHHRIRRRRAYQYDPSASPQRGSCQEVFQRLLAGGVSPDRLHDAVSTLQIELVLTAHPTEIARRTLVHKYNRIAAALATRDRDDLTAPERDDIESTLLREILSAWGTNDVRSERPTPLDEVRSGLIVFEESLWTAVPRYLRGVDHALRASTGRGLSIGAAPLRFGSWIGGDRDGNPNVTPGVTRRACLLARWVAVTLYFREIDALRDELSVGAATPELKAAGGNAPEPYRELLRDVRRRLRATRDWIERALEAETDPAPSEDVVLETRDLLGPLQLCADSLERTGYGALAQGRLADVMRRLATFGMTLARLDIRQEASGHTDALTEISLHAGLGAYGEWDEAMRVQFLERELRAARLALPSSDVSPAVRDVVETFRVIAAIPRSSLGAYVITMASQSSDILAVALLQQMAGVARPLRIVPLFETSRDLENAGAVLDALFANTWYGDHIGGRQEVMIGYSDSAKEVGRFAAAWDLYRAQEEVLAAGRRHGVDVTLFHGRGGSVGRGGGPTYLAIMSQPPGSIDGALRVTEQGEMLQALFGLPEIAARTMDVYTTATLEAWLIPPPPPRPEWRGLAGELRDDAASAYRGLVHENPMFLEYFHEATPVSELSAMNIGSRPARRKGGEGDVTNLRAIPWQFAWTQTRLLLAAWLGIEEALANAIGRGELERLREMYGKWPHFRSVIDLTEMVLAKAEPRIAEEYDRRLVPSRLQPIGAELRARLDRAMSAVLSVTGHRDLIESNPVLRRSIDVRNPYVDPINLLQIELLRRFREDPDEQVRAALHVTINGIAAGMRNTG